MRLSFSKLFLLAACFAFLSSAHGQSNPVVCTGSLGDPVINQNFGSGPNPGKQLLSGFTNMTYTSSNCPEDGFYTISNSLVSPGNCHPTWHDVVHDHTGNPNGYMMIVNASFQPSVFFTQTASGLCPNTTYEFSAYVLNLIRRSTASLSVSEPNITFSIKTPAGDILATYSTGVIPATDTVNWVKYGVYFSTPAATNSVIVTMTNNAPGGNGNDLVLDDITFRACGPVIQAGFGSVSEPVSQVLCEGTSATYQLQANIADNLTHQYQWQQNLNGAGWTDIANQTSATLSVALTKPVAGTYQYRVGVGNGLDISSVDCRVYSSPLTLTVNPLPVVAAIAGQTVCEGHTLQLAATGGGSYLWSGPGISNSTQNPLVINNVTAANQGTYTVLVTSDKGCAAAPVQTKVTVVPAVVASVSSDAGICAGASTRLTASGGLYYKWTPSTGLYHDDIPNPVASPLQTTKYSVNVSNDGCNDDTKSVNVTVWQLPVADAGADRKMFEGQSIKLAGIEKGDLITSAYWSPSTALSDPNSLTPTASPVADITYTLTVVSRNCSISTSSVFVRVYQKITIPNAFTPNNDGNNDKWNIDALVTYPEGLITVFDRYGHQVYQSQGYSKPWDGTYNGAQLAPGTYYYIIDLKNNTPKIAGWVALVR